jgi:DNA-binding transcriptional regulator YdaS (Cro superfamily)
MVKLSDYLEARSETVVCFAARVGVAPSTIYRLIKGDTNCTADLARKINVETDGKVTPNDLILPLQNTSVPQHGGNASPVKAATGDRESPAPEGAALSVVGDSRDAREPTAAADRWAGRVVQCALCERRLTGATVRACQAPDCPQSERDAA